MKINAKKVPTLFGPETRFEVSPFAAAPFRAVQENQFERLKNRLVAERLAESWQQSLSAPLRRAANEAAAVAWTTRYPLLVFPLLFEEKADQAVYQAARQAGVRKFVFVSIPQGMEPCPLTAAKRTVEQAVMSSGMDYTILCPCIFMEVWLSPALGIDYPNAKATIYGDGHARTSCTSLGDVAEYAVQSLDNPAARNTLFELGHPQTHNLLEVVRLFEKASGKAFELQVVPAVALEAQRNAATDPLQVSFAALMHNMATGIQVNTSGAQKAFPGIELKSVPGVASQAIISALPRGG